MSAMQGLSQTNQAGLSKEVILEFISELLGEVLWEGFRQSLGVKNDGNW